MKLAEALQLRADLNRTINQLNNRLNTNAIYQEGEKPNEDPKELLTQLNSSVEQLQKLISQINITNVKTVVEGRTVTEMIAEKDCLSTKIRIYTDLVEAASSNTRRATRTEIKILPSVDVKSMQKEIDSMSKKLRLLDNKIQQTNWTVDLIEE